MSMGYESKIPIEGIEIYRRHRNRLTDRASFDALFEELRTEIDDPSGANLMELLVRPEVIDRAFEAHASSPGWPSVCEAIFCSLEDTSNWGNKLLRVEMTPTLMQNWPDARFLVLTRDPRGVMASQAKKFDHSLEYSAMYWNTHSEFVIDRIGLPPHYKVPNHMVVDLVEMARDPKPALDWAFAEVGLSTDPTAGLVERFPGDPDRLDNWRNTLAPSRQRRVEEYCFTPMTALGYRPELAVAPRPIGKVKRVVALVREHGSEILRDPGSIRRKQVGKRVKSALGMGR
jgi:hypothetical protein